MKKEKKTNKKPKKFKAEDYIPKHPDYTHEEILAITAKFDSLVLMKNDYMELYLFIRKEKLQQIYCSHMRISNQKITLEYLQEQCSQYKDPIELRQKDNRLYRHIVGKNLLSTLFPDKSHQFKYTKESLQELVKQYETIADFRRLHAAAYNSAQRQGFLEEITKGMKPNSYTGSKYSLNEILNIAKDFTSMSEFQWGNQKAYNQAKKRKWLPKIRKLYKQANNSVKYTEEEVIALSKEYINFKKFRQDHPLAVAKIYRIKRKDLFDHMEKETREPYSFKELKNIAKQYKTRSEFSKENHGAFMAAFRRGILDDICEHMEVKVRYQTDEDIIKMAKKFKRRSDFQKHAHADYILAKKRGIFEECCKHMEEPDSNRFFPEEELFAIAQKYKYRRDFYNEEHAAYEACRRKGILDKVCSHMVAAPNKQKKMEREILAFVQSIFLDAKNQWFRNLNIKRKPYIKAFEIDIFVPSLNKGVELDGTFWHTPKQMLKQRRQWPVSARKNYHKIKDQVFKEYFNIDILHISDKDWLERNLETKERIYNFLTS